MTARISSARNKKAWLLALIPAAATMVLAATVMTAGANAKITVPTHATLGQSSLRGDRPGFKKLAPNSDGAIRSSLSFCSDHYFGPNRAESIQEPIGFTGSFFGLSFSKVWINGNGTLTFSKSYFGIPTKAFALPSFPIIAPFWADIDTTALVPYTGAYGPYAKTPYSDQIPATWGTGTFEGNKTFCVDYPSAGYYSATKVGPHDGMDKRDSFQVLLIDRATTGAGNFDIEFNYNHIAWDAGDASGGHDGLAGNSGHGAAVFWTAGDGIAGHSYVKPGSGVGGKLLDSNDETGLVNNSFGNDPNGNADGRYYFQVRGKVKLTVAKSGKGKGSVSSSPKGITCGSTCSANFSNGQAVTLTETPAQGSAFTGWSGGGCTGSTDSTCKVTMSSPKMVTATFQPAKILTVKKSGTGKGTVSSDPNGIACGSTCSAPFGSGSTVTLTATPLKGSVFTGWSGGGCSGTGTCQVTISKATTVTAGFGPAQTLTVKLAGAGKGTVSSNPSGISCGSDCTGSFANGQKVTLTATAAKGSAFSGWSGACSGSGSTCKVTMNGAEKVTATFKPKAKASPQSRRSVAHHRR